MLLCCWDLAAPQAPPPRPVPKEGPSPTRLLEGLLLGPQNVLSLLYLLSPCCAFQRLPGH